MISEPPASHSQPGGPSRSKRRKLQQVLEIEWGSSQLTGQVQDITLSGMFIKLAPPLWLGATFSARLLVNPPLQLHCTVCRVEPGEGIAVRFQLPDPSSRAQLEELLASLPTI